MEDILPADVCVYTQLLSHIWFFVTPWTVAQEAPLSMGFSRQEYWDGLSFPPPGDLLDTGVELVSPPSPAFSGKFFTIEPPRKPYPLGEP